MADYDVSTATADDGSRPVDGRALAHVGSMRFGALLLMRDGVVHRNEATDAAVRRFMTSAADHRTVQRRLRDAVAPLRRLGLVRLVDQTYYATNLADLCAWMADEWERREDAGLSVAPRIPEQRSAA